MWDGIIIGGGLAGLIAGIRASERGKRILMIAKGTGSLSASSGALDIGPIPRLARVKKHPYSFLDAQKILAGVHYFRSLLPEYEERGEEPFLVLTPLGLCRTTDLVPPGLKAEVLARSKKIVLMAPEGMKDFFPRVVKDNLEKEFPQSKVEIYPFEVSAFALWKQGGIPINGLEFARFWRTEEGMEALKKLLNSLARNMEVQAGEKSAVIFPGFSRVFAKPLQELLAQFPFPIVEMTDMPPAFGGEILYNALKRKFKDFGGEIILGSGVRKGDTQGKTCQQVWVRSKGRDTNVQAREFVLATGGIYGGGIEAAREGVNEKVLGLPLFVPEEWTRAQFLGEQPYARLGVEVNAELRPVDPQSGEILLENVRVVGRSIAHWDPWVEYCGGGVSLATGWLAGEMLE